MLEGIQICRGAPSVTHLLFADDSIFYLKATIRNAIQLKTILLEYQKISGQKINLQKSEVVFSSNTPSSLQLNLIQILEVQRAAEHSRYLGLPLVMGNKKIDLFQFIVDRMYKRTMGWKEKLLSAAGKEVLITSILQAIPNYIMSCFKIPDTLCKRLCGIIAKYWWSNNMDAGNIFWSKYNLLTKEKAQGGMGFRDLRSANEALLCKQFWRIIAMKNTMVNRVMRAKYVKRQTEYPILGYRPSYAWRSIWQAGRRLWNFMPLNEYGNRFWQLHSSGDFITKTAYSKLKEIKEIEFNNVVGETSDNNATVQMWKKLWKLKVQSKVKIFLWKLFHGFLPLSFNLNRRGCNVPENCMLCTNQVEDEFHVFLDCWWARVYWKGVGNDKIMRCRCGISIQDWILKVFISCSSTEMAEMTLGFCNIWFNRNQVYHDKPMMNPFDMARKTKLDVFKFSDPEFQFVVSEVTGDGTWQAPSRPFIKLNCDASFSKQKNEGGLACVIRDHDRLILGVRTWRVENVKNSMQAEVQGIGLAIEWAVQRGWGYCIFETDCVEAFKSILQCRNTTVGGDFWFLKCARMLAKNNNWQLSLICREGNKIADFLARKILADDWCWTAENSLPRFWSF